MDLIKVTVDDLSTNESTTLSYNVSAYIVSSNATVQTLGMRKFTTLKDDYETEKITQINAHEWMDKIDEKTGEAYLNLAIEWLPARDRTCSYDVVYFGKEFDIDERDVPLESLYYFIIPQRLKYDEDYSIAVRGKNTQNLHIQGDVVWVRFHSKSCEMPACMGNFTKMKIHNISLNLTHLGDKFFNVTASWETNLIPESIVISIRDADQNNHNITKDPVIIRSSQNTHTFEKVLILGTSVSVNLTAFIGDDSDTEIGYMQIPIYVEDKIDDILFYSLVAIMCLLLIALFKVWKGRIDSFISILAQKRLENMDLEAVKTMSTGTVLDSIAELTKDDSMEVERENITILELLGEGAFGLVKKALMIRNGEKEYVAVKMLKSE